MCFGIAPSDYYKYASTNDPFGPKTGTGRVTRGGAYAHAGNDLRCSHRSYDAQGNTHDGLGVRLAAAIELSERPTRSTSTVSDATNDAETQQPAADSPSTQEDKSDKPVQDGNQD